MLDQDGRPLSLTWRYDRAELVADGVVHAIGITFGLAGTATMAAFAPALTRAVELTSVLIYTVSLLAVLGISAAYNMWPVSRTKWMLRRFDHAAIYLLIAGTYTPFLTQIRSGPVSAGLFVVVWATAIVGIALKLTLPGRFDRLSIGLYLAVSWSGVLAYDAVASDLPVSTLWLLGIGGLLYTIGVIFHLWESLRFHNAVWHAFVLVACIFHYGAVLDCLVLARA